MAAQQIVAANTLIENLVAAGFGVGSYFPLLGTLFHPRAAELPPLGGNLRVSEQPQTG